MTPVLTLSQTPTAIRWMGKFPLAQQQALASLLDTILLLDDTAVADALLTELKAISPSDRVALYAEREVAEAEFFVSENFVGTDGNITRRAVGRRGPPAVKPKRGSSRVGSEGFIAFTISQVVKQDSRFLNHPGPDRFRKKGKKGVRHIAIVTDFIGSGTRIRKQLDALWRVPTIASWHSLGLIRFHVVAAVSTAEGIEYIEKHRSRPKVCARFIAPTLGKHTPRREAEVWTELAIKWGPSTEPLGYQDGGALVAFRYGFPNNAPRFLWDKGSERPPLFHGPAPSDAIDAFRTGSSGLTRLLRAFRSAAHWLRTRAMLIFQSPERAQKVLFLSSLRGRWKPGKEIEIALRTGLTVPEVVRLRIDTFQHGWIGADGRITDLGRTLLKAASVKPRQKPVVRTNGAAYYPRRLRVP